MTFKTLEELRKEIEKFVREGEELQVLREEVKVILEFKSLLVKEIGD